MSRAMACNMARQEKLCPINYPFFKPQISPTVGARGCHSAQAPGNVQGRSTPKSPELVAEAAAAPPASQANPDVDARVLARACRLRPQNKRRARQRVVGNHVPQVGPHGMVQGCQMVYFQTKNPNLGKF
jgi:hypothetical protein